jgi:hypothetical protein
MWFGVCICLVMLGFALVKILFITLDRHGLILHQENKNLNTATATQEEIQAPPTPILFYSAVP